MKINISSRYFQEAVYNNGYTNLMPHAKSSGFKINSIKMQAIDNETSLAEDFLVSLGFNKNQIEAEQSILSYLLPTGTTLIAYANHEANQQFDKVLLPKSVPLNMSLEHALRKRRSIRHYTGDSIPLNYLATILRAACGISTRTPINLEEDTTISIAKRTTASAGGIYPVDVYIAAYHVEKLTTGVFQYNPAEDCLVQLYDDDVANKLLQAFSTTEDQVSLKRACFVIFLVGSAHKSMYKYGNNGLAFTLHEVGCISQNIHLAATALGLGSVDCASYYRKLMHGLLQFDGVYKHLFHTIIAGVH